MTCVFSYHRITWYYIIEIVAWQHVGYDLTITNPAAFLPNSEKGDEHFLKGRLFKNMDRTECDLYWLCLKSFISFFIPCFICFPRNFRKRWPQKLWEEFPQLNPDHACPTTGNNSIVKSYDSLHTAGHLTHHTYLLGTQLGKNGIFWNFFPVGELRSFSILLFRHFWWKNMDDHNISLFTWEIFRTQPRLFY